MIELRRLRTQIRISPTVWILTIELARVCGWNPAGTLQAGDANNFDALGDVRHLMGWQAEYLSNDGQTVTAADAKQLADALDRVSIDGAQILSDWSEGRIHLSVDVRTAPTGFGWFNTTDGKNHLRLLTDFCRGGEFQIF